jgi:hypothetical protein
MFGKNDPVDNLCRGLDRLRDKRDALTCDVTTITIQIAELETQLSEEKDRRERERVGGVIEGIKKQLEDTAATFVPAVAELRDATATAAVVVPEAHELHGLLLGVATEVNTVIEQLLRELDRRVQELRAGHAVPHLPLPLNGPPEPPKNNEHLHRLPKWLPHNPEATKKAAA